MPKAKKLLVLKNRYKNRTKIIESGIVESLTAKEVVSNK